MCQRPPKRHRFSMKDTLKWEEATFTAAHEESGHVRGEKSAMIAHLIGRKPCPYASSVAKRKAAQIKAMTRHEAAGTGGANIPFSSAEIEHVCNQFLHTTISANLPFQWTEDVEIIKLFIMSDGWKDDSKNPITGVNISANGKSYLINLIQSNRQKKDGASMCLAFESMIDKAEQDYGCIVMYFHSTKGQLILSDYLVVNEEASVVAEQATDLIHWILSHDHVRKILIDDAQHEKNFVVLVYPLANITQWTTHYVAFHHLLELKAPLRHAAYLRQEEIIEVQLRCEQNRKAVKKITKTTNA
ncbi:hypothetical protein C8J57DRAFT_1249115 [Mycena rebaudengoi]|nr:hypothetical protein C8J57DRAFT_1249115 [Mycena rebaudengoi]